SSLIARRVATSNIVTVASPRYLEQYEKITHPQQLSKHNCICYTYTANKNNWRFSIENHIYNVEVGSNFTTNNGEIQLGFALDHLGITRVPEFFVSEHIENGNLQKILTQYDNESVDIYVVYASRKHQSARVRSFIEFITQTLH
ncbi:MAG: DNA-binding transcriptional LysR family regulator, partial [Oceanospirillaceae bacterium]